MSANKFEIQSIFVGVDRLSRPVGKMGASIERFQTRASGSFGKLSNGFNVVGAAAKAATVSIAAIGGAATFALIDAAKTGAQFEQSLTNATAKFPGQIKRGTAAFRELSDAAKETGRSTEFTASQSAEALNFLAAAGFNANQAISSLPGVVDLATASNTDLAFASDVATDSLSAFGLMSEDSGKLTKNLTRINDVFAKTVTTSNTTMETLFETIKQGGPTMRAAGADVETFGALTGVMGNASIKGSQAGTTLKNMFVRLAKPVGEAEVLLRRLGVTTKDSKGDMRDMFDIVEDLNKGLSGKGTADKLAVIETIFGKIALSGVNVVLAEGADGLRKYREELRNADGESNRMATTMRDTVTGSFKTFASAVEGVKVELFDLNRGELKKFIDDGATWVRENQPAIIAGFKDFITVLRATAKAIGAVVSGYQSLMRVSRQSDIVQGLGNAAEIGGRIIPEALAGAIKGDFSERMGGLFKGNPLLGAGEADNRVRMEESPEISNGVVFEPMTLDGDPAFTGAGTTTTSREEKTTTTRVIVEPAAGTKATVEGEATDNVQLAPTGGL